MKRKYPAIEPDQIPEDWKPWVAYARSEPKTVSLVRAAHGHSVAMAQAVGLALSAAKWITGKEMPGRTLLCGLCYVDEAAYDCTMCPLHKGNCMRLAEAGESMKLYIEHMEKHPNLRDEWRGVE